jgi:hypothetical protein
VSSTGYIVHLFSSDSVNRRVDLKIGNAWFRIKTSGGL